METKQTTYTPTLSEISEVIKSHINDGSGLELNHTALDIATIVKNNSAEDNAEYSHDEFLKQCGLVWNEKDGSWIEGSN